MKRIYSVFAVIIVFLLIGSAHAVGPVAGTVITTDATVCSDQSTATSPNHNALICSTNGAGIWLVITLTKNDLSSDTITLTYKTAHPRNTAFGTIAPAAPVTNEMTAISIKLPSVSGIYKYPIYVADGDNYAEITFTFSKATPTDVVSVATYPMSK